MAQQYRLPVHYDRIRKTADEFHRICGEFLDHDEPMAMLPAEQTAVSEPQLSV